MSKAPAVIRPNHKAVKEYYRHRAEVEAQGVTNEQSIRGPFQSLLEQTARKQKWTFIPEQPVEGVDRRIVPDGTMRDDFQLPRGYWEAKDTHDDLDAEIENKRKIGYPFKNIIFEDTQQAVLIQEGEEVFSADMRDSGQLVRLLNRFYSFQESVIKDFDQAVNRFQEDIQPLAKGLMEKITLAHQRNKAFQETFANFMTICEDALNPNIRAEAVDEMLIQHLLTERLMRTVFDMPGFVQRNVIAGEVEKVITALTSRYFNRAEFLGQLDYFYQAIEDTAGGLRSFAEKQRFLNTVYERFFQGYSVDIADTHGIVYTPQEIVDFMGSAVEEVLQTEFGKQLGDEGVVILDPCTGTGNFIVNLLRRIPRQNLERAYRQQFFANEVMLLPYYIASLNIEHEYRQLTGRYEPFEGICFVDTLDLAEGQQMRLAFMTEENTERVERQKRTPITVIIGNPPYNMGQVNENDNNKNRTYEVIDERVGQTYVKDSRATLRNKLYDPYVKFFRWATDRLGEREGIVCMVTNNSFVDQIAFDGMRKHLAQDFSHIYVVDLQGNIRKDSMRDGIPLGENHTVFGLAAMVGISITVLVRSNQYKDHQIHYSTVDWRATRQEKFSFLERVRSISGVEWTELKPDNRHTWLVPEHADEFSSFLPIGTKEAKKSSSSKSSVVFGTYSLGNVTSRDSYVYSFDFGQLSARAEMFVEIYNRAVDVLGRPGGTTKPEDLIDTEDQRIKWSRQVKRSLKKRDYSKFDIAHIRNALYRPYSKKLVYFDDFWIEERYQQHRFFPTPETEQENLVMALTDRGSEKPFMMLITNTSTDYHLVGAGSSAQCFPFYTYSEDGSNRRENITDWALAQFRDHYGDKKISKWDIFYYVYGLLHHPGYRERYADNLKRELPRLPYAPDFWPFSEAGKKLADLHLNYEEVKEWKLDWVWDEDVSLREIYRVEKMRLSKDKTELRVNNALTLRGIPPGAFDYRLGNRSALDWVINQYRVKTDKRSGIRSDPNNPDDEQYIVKLVGRVVRVSMETCEIVNALPGNFGGGNSGPE